MVGAYRDVMMYVTVIRMAFTLTDQHRVASFSLPTLVEPFHSLPTSLVHYSAAVHATSFHFISANKSVGLSVFIAIYLEPD